MKKYIVFLAKAGVAFGIIYYLLQKIDFITIVQTMVSADPFYFGLAFGLAMLHRYILASQMRVVLDHQGISFSSFKIFIINLESNFYDLFVPGGSSAAKWYKFSQPEGKRSQAFSSIVIIRLLNILVTVAIGAIALLLRNPFKSHHLGILVIGILALLVFLLLSIFNQTLSSVMDTFLNKLMKLAPDLIREKTAKVRVSFNYFQEMLTGEIAFIFLLSIFLHLLGAFQFFLISVSLHIDISFLSIVWIASAVLVIQMIPISISGIGVREGVLFFLLGKYRIPGSESLAFSFLILTLAVLIALIGGIIETRYFLKQKFL